MRVLAQMTADDGSPRKRSFLRRVPSPALKCYYIRIETSEKESVMRRVAIIHGTFYRILKASKLKRVIAANYDEGWMELVVEAPEISPEIVPGDVTMIIQEDE